jgi:hypothetical protein
MSAMGPDSALEGDSGEVRFTFGSRNSLRSRQLQLRANSVILRRKKASLFDYLVGAQQCRSRHVEGQRLGRLEIEDELEFRCALNREFGRPSA